MQVAWENTDVSKPYFHDPIPTHIKNYKIVSHLVINALKCRVKYYSFLIYNRNMLYNMLNMGSYRYNKLYNRERDNKDTP